MDVSGRNTIDAEYERLDAAGGLGIRFTPSWGTHRELFSQSTDGRRFTAIDRGGCAPCAFSGCKELAFTESRFGPVCEDHAGAALVR